MQKEIEIEYKMMLTKNEYDTLYDKLPFPKQAVKQTNYYFETNDFLLKQKNCALRIREKNNSYTLTLKQAHENHNLEIHEQISKSQFNAWLNNEQTLSKKMEEEFKKLMIPNNKLQFFGSLITERRQFEQNKIIYVLDKSSYHNITDYELEIEAPNQSLGKQTFYSLLDEKKIEHKKTIPKIARFFNSLEH